MFFIAAKDDHGNEGACEDWIGLTSQKQQVMNALHVA